jgi:hypothetical protein
VTDDTRPLITREQQAELDPILNQAADFGFGLIPVADLIMAAYKLGRTHGQQSPAAALKARLATMPGAEAPEIIAAILDGVRAQHATGAPLWVLRCSADIAQAHRFPGLRVEVMRDWLSGRWELRDNAGQVIVNLRP